MADRVVFEGETPRTFAERNARVTMRLTPFANTKQLEWCETFLTVAPPPGWLVPSDFQQSIQEDAA